MGGIEAGRRQHVLFPPWGLEEMEATRPILVIEDSDDDFYAIARLLRQFSLQPIARCEKGDEALNFLAKKNRPPGSDAAPRPGLILLDLNLPGLDGRALLSLLKENPEVREIPIVVITSSSSPTDIMYCYRHCAGGYLVKSVDLEKFTRSLEALVKYWFDAVVLPPATQTYDGTHS
jgi:CheY-like chemotaxis protein